MPNTPQQAPSAAELLADPEVRAALEKAWIDSNPYDPHSRQEQGGWIHLSEVSRKTAVRRASVGGQASIDLNHPPILDGYLVVGKFHTHPNPSSEGWDPGPSTSDRRIDERHGVPDLIFVQTTASISADPSVGVEAWPGTLVIRLDRIRSGGTPCQIPQFESKIPEFPLIKR